MLTGIASEEFRAVDCYLNYEVSNIGRVRNSYSGKILKQYLGKDNIYRIKLYKNGTLISSGNASSVVADGYNTTGSWNMITLVANGVSSWNTHNRLSIATRSDSLNSATNMKMGSFNIYNRELSAAEIDNLYTAGLPTYQPSSSTMVNQGLTLYLDATNPKINKF